MPASTVNHHRSFRLMLPVVSHRVTPGEGDATNGGGKGGGGGGGGGSEGGDGGGGEAGGGDGGDGAAGGQNTGSRVTHFPSSNASQKMSAPSLSG